MGEKRGKCGYFACMQNGQFAGDISTVVGFES